MPRPPLSSSTRGIRRGTSMTQRVRAIRAACGAVAAISLGWVMPAADAATKIEDPLVLGINEGATDNKSADELRRQYASLAKVLSRVSGKPVVVEPYVDVALFRRKFDDG